jgi:hydrogenase maturation factor/phosphoglycolate phosphatase-like HAD superfamily hydrolase
VLEFIQGLKGIEERRAADEKLAQFEMQAAIASKPNPQVSAILTWLKARSLHIGVITRNSRVSILRALGNFTGLDENTFDLIISRDDPMAPKPSGDGIAWAARQWGLQTKEVVLVGDFLFDIQAGRDAGALTALLDPQNDPQLREAECDFRLRQLADLKPIIREGLPLSAGKLPNEILQVFLGEFGFEDPSVLISAGVGEDIAAVDVAHEDVLVLKSDPITFATDAIGRYAVMVNANDIATAGAVPRWFLTTLLMPGGTTPSRIRVIMYELAEVCRREGITLCGGHTEISNAVNRPVVIGMMAGTVKRKALIEKRDMRAGDLVLLTKAVAVEGTAIVAREFEKRLLSKGLLPQDIDAGKEFLNSISIVVEARLATRDRLASAMHDVTEGGVATALNELSAAGGHKLAIDLDKIPVFKETRKICTALDLNPLGLIGSGSLLICCRPDRFDVLSRRLKSRDIAVTVIGRVLDPGEGIEAFFNGQASPWPRFEVDEITRLFNRQTDSP